LDSRYSLAALRAVAVSFLLASPLCVASGCSSSNTADGASARSDSLSAADSKEKDAKNPPDSTSDAAASEESRRDRTASVSAAKAFRGELVVPLVAEGTIRARHSAEIRSEIGGPVVDIQASEGQTVRRGQLIAKLDDREYAVSAEEARALYIAAISRLAIEEDSIEVLESRADAQAQIDELKRLEAKGLITREERMAREVALDVEAIKKGRYRVEVVASRSGIAAARAAMERAQINLERTEIRAPFPGVVTGLHLSAGEHVAAGQTLCTLVDNTDLEAEVGVLESDIGFLDVGRRALLAIPALGDTLPATVDVISPHFARDSRTCQVLLRLSNLSGKVRPGMFARAIVAGRTFPDRLLVPHEAVLVRDGRHLLFKVEDGVAKWLYVELGARNDHMVEIAQVLQGGSLAAGDLVVVSDHLTLAHDAKVKVKNVVATRDPWARVE
jgi:HlyD family secretion protein